jgi:hypothetical protein
MSASASPDGRNLVYCVDCRAFTREYLVHRNIEKSWLFFRWRGEKLWPLCREHLVERFRADFLAAGQRMVVFCPDRGERRTAYQYSYHTADEVRKICNVTGPDSAIPAKIQSWLAATAGSCARCGASAQVAFFPASALTWEEVPRKPVGVEYDHPLLRLVTDDPEVLCRACAAAEVCQALQASPADRGFDEGVNSPLGCADGIMLTTMPSPFG